VLGSLDIALESSDEAALESWEEGALEGSELALEEAELEVL